MPHEFIAKNGLIVANNGQLKLTDQSGTASVNLQSPQFLSGGANYSLILPPSLGASGQTLKLMNSNGDLSFSNILLSGSIVSGFIGNDAVASGNIGSGQIGINHLASGVVQNFISGGITINGAITPIGSSYNNATLTISTGLTGGSYNGSGAVTIAIGSGGVTSGLIASGQVGAFHIGDNSITSGKIASGQVSNFALGSGVVTSGQIGIAAVNNLNINSGTVANDKLVNSSITINGTSVALGGNVTISSVLTSGQVTSGYLGNASVVSGSIASGSISSQHLGVASGIMDFSQLTYDPDINGFSWEYPKTTAAKVKNGTGAIISGFAVVYISGAVGSTPSVGLAIANSDSFSLATFGVATANISANSEGQVVTQGILRNVNTTAFNAGDTLWLSPTVPGGVQTAKPQAPDHLVLVGWVLDSASNGKIEVNIQNGYELYELHDVRIISGSLSSGQVLQWSSGVWWNQSFIAGSNNLGSGVVISGKIGNNAVSSGNIASGQIGSSHIASGAVVSGQIGIAAVNNINLFNSSISINGSSTSLGSSYNNATLTFGSGLETGSYNGSGAVTVNIGSGKIINTFIGSGLTLVGSGSVNSGSLASGFSEITINNTRILLGSSGTISSVTPNSLTNGTGIASFSFNGSSVASVSIASGGVSSGLLANNAVVSGSIGSGQIGGFHIISGLVKAGSNVSVTVDGTNTYTINATVSGGVAVEPLTVNSGLVLANGTSFNGSVANTIGIASGGVISNLIADNAVTSDKIASGQVTGSKIAATTVANANLVNSTISINGVSTALGASYNNSTLTIGTGLTGGSYNGSGAVTIAVGSGAIVSGLLGDNSVSTNAIASGQVTGSKIAATTVANANLVNSSISINGASTALGASYNNATLTIGTGLTGGSYNGSGAVTIAVGSGAIVSGLLGDNSVSTNAIASGQVTGSKIAASTITGTNIANTTVANANLVNSSISINGASTALGASYNNATLTIGTGLTGGSYNGSGAVTIAVGSGAIVSGLIGNFAVNNLNITSGTVANDKLANSSITINGALVSLGGSTTINANTNNTLSTASGLLGGPFNGSAAVTIGIASGGIVSQMLGSGAVTSGAIASGQVGTNSIAAASILSGQIGANVIGSPHILAGSIANASLANSTVTIAGSSTSLGGSWAAQALTTASGLLAGTFYPSGALTIGIASGGLVTAMFGSGAIQSGAIAASQIVKRITAGAGIAVTANTDDVQVSAINAGTVTTVSVTSTNGFAGTVANASSTPAITISTTISGLLIGNSTSIANATQITYNPTGTIFRATAAGTTDIPLVARGVASQTGSLQEWQSSAGTALATMDANGNFSAVSKSFYIDHPSKPGMKLRHVCVEAPTADVYIRGKSTSKTIELPSYWENLVDMDSLTVLLTPVEKQQNIYVKNIDKMMVYIEGDDSPIYNYVIFAERIDIPKVVVEE